MGTGILMNAAESHHSLTVIRKINKHNTKYKNTNYREKYKLMKNTGSANAARQGGTSGEGKSSNQENASNFLKRLVLKMKNIVSLRMRSLLMLLYALLPYRRRLVR